MKAQFPARLHVLLARQAPFGVVIRRGPAQHTCFIGWDRQSDRFETSQWLKGRIYERRSDLSPDGQHMIYFAMNGHWHSETKGAWTAISKSPWMKAIALLAKGDCWQGGGLFLDDRTYWLNGGCGHEIIYDTRDVVRDTSYAPKGFYGGECPGVYYLRLQRDGWGLQDREAQGRSNDMAIFEKPLANGWVLKKIAHAQVGPPQGRACYWDEHELINGNNQVRECPDWEWADWDGGRIVWASQGCLYACTINTETALSNPVQLYDFNDMKFENVAAPY